MNKVGQIVATNIKTLVTGRSSLLGSALSKNLIGNRAPIYSVDLKIPSDLYAKNEQFMQGNVADATFLKNYLRQIGTVDAFVNCAAVRKCKLNCEFNIVP
jgi:nucleoside-diphosphate-sugar epimerase